MTITPIYAAVLALIYVALSFRVIGVRRKQRISLGDGENEELRRRMRVHGNFIEYVPMVLILMALAEMQDRSIYVIHLIGVCILVGRLAHAFGVTNSVIPARVGGMVLTFVALITGAMANLGLSSLATMLVG